jgi:hypothetical protein
LLHEGLLTREQVEQIDSFRMLCNNDNWTTVNGEEGVLDVVMQEILRDEDTVRLSDGHCYSRANMLEHIRTGTVPMRAILDESGQRTGRYDYHHPKLPASNLEMRESDYRILGIEPPTEEEMLEAIDRSIDVQFESAAVTDEDQERHELWHRFRRWQTRAQPAQAAREEFAQYLLAPSDEQDLQRLAHELGTTAAALVPRTPPPTIVAAPPRRERRGTRATREAEEI